MVTCGGAFKRARIIAITLIEVKAMQKARWQQNMVFLWFGNFMTGMGFSMTMPFLPLYIQTLGHFNAWQLNLLSGTAFAITFLAKAIASPFWGKLADPYGRKPMCLRASCRAARYSGAQYSK